MRSEEPALGQRDHQMGARQEVVGVLGLATLHLRFVDVALQLAKGVHSVGLHGAARRDFLRDKA